MFISSCEEKYIISDKSSSSYNHVSQDHLKGMPHMRSTVHIGDSSSDKVFHAETIAEILRNQTISSKYCLSLYSLYNECSYFSSSFFMKKVFLSLLFVTTCSVFAGG